MSKTCCRVVCLLLSACFSLFSQNTAGTGSISGTLVDASGGAVPGAVVVVANESKGIRRQMESTEGGLFNAPSLIPADGYTITITKAGFSEFSANNISLQVGQTINLTTTLQLGNASTKVEVTSEVPLVETTKSDVSGLVDSRQILELPINGRRVDSFVLLTPGVTSDASFGLLTFRGLAGGNSFLTDGIDTTNSFYDENAGRTRTYNISQDSVQEFQVITSGSLAEYGKASGGVVNTITRSGTNATHGTGYWFYRNRTLNATDISSNGLRPQDWRHQAGISVGGPIKKDKLFYFFNGEVQRRNFPVVSSNIQNSLFNGTNTLTLTPTICPSGATAPTAAQCAAAASYLTTRAQTQLIPREADVNLLFGKVDYQINERNRATFEMNYVDFHSPNGIQTQSSLPNGNAIGNNANTTVFDRTGKAGLTTIVSPTMVNEFKFGFFKDRQFDPASPNLLPSIGPIGLSISGANSISNIGYATGYPRLLPSEQRFQFSDTFSQTAGTHNIKYGFDFDNTEDYISQVSNRFGTYSYSSFANFALDFSGVTTGKHWSGYSQRFGTPSVDFNTKNMAAFIQDEWKVTPKLTISPGIRYEKAFVPQPVGLYPSLVNPALPQTNHIPQVDFNFAPRVGIAYAWNDKTVIRGDYGIFHNRYVTSSIENLIINNGVYQAQYSLTSGATPSGIAQLAAGPSFPNALAAAPPVTGTATPAIADPAFRTSYSEQASLSVERQLSGTSSLTVSYLWDRGLHLLSGYDANAATPSQSYTYPILDATGNVVNSFTTPIYTKRINPLFKQIIAATSSGQSWYSGLAVQYNKRLSSWFQSQISYTYSHAIDTNVGGGGNTLYSPSSPTSVFNGNYSGERGSSSTDQRHHLVANFVVNPKFTDDNNAFEKYVINHWQLSSIYSAASAQPLVPNISVGSNLGNLPAGQAISLLSTGTLDGLGGSSRVPFQSISALDGDQLYRVDARLSKTFPVKERLKLTLMFEAFNVFNHHFYSGTAPRTTQEYSTTQTTINGVKTIALAPYALYGAWGTSSAPLEGTTARRAQAALRFEF